MPNRALKIFFDGGCRPNPGQMETAVVARGATYLQSQCGWGDSNDAEWLALIHAAEVALNIGACNIVLLGDSALVVGQASGVAKCRTPKFRAHLDSFHTLSSQFDSVKIRKTGRSQNLAGIALTKARWA